MAVELAFDHHIDQPRAETRSPAPPRGGAPTFLPVEDKGKALLRARDRPAQIDAAGGDGKAAMLAGVGRQLVHRHAQPKGRIGLEENIRSAERDAIEECGKQCVEKLAERR